MATLPATESQVAATFKSSPTPRPSPTSPVSTAPSVRKESSKDDLKVVFWLLMSHYLFLGAGCCFNFWSKHAVTNASSISMSDTYYIPSLCLRLLNRLLNFSAMGKLTPPLLWSYLQNSLFNPRKRQRNLRGQLQGKEHVHLRRRLWTISRNLTLKQTQVKRSWWRVWTLCWWLLFAGFSWKMYSTS